jgi:hypothetical protein
MTQARRQSGLVSGFGSGETVADFGRGVPFMEDRGLLDRPLKDLSAKQLEDAIGEMITEIVGPEKGKYVADIQGLTFNPRSELNAVLNDALELRVIIKKDLSGIF